jgi:glycosyltransferase involved in cell wall biosynthesis
MICTVGRLVPHKQVEHAIDAVVALREEFPDLRLHVVGSGWWEGTLHEYVETRGATDLVVFDGHVDEVRKNEVFEAAWLLALPSLKEGWGLVVGEAGLHHTPTVAYRSAGGTRESIADGISGVLVEDRAGMARALGELLRDPEKRTRLADGAGEMSRRFTWEHAQISFAHVVASALRGVLIDSQDPEEDENEAGQLVEP